MFFFFLPVLGEMLLIGIFLSSAVYRRPKSPERWHCTTSSLWQQNCEMMKIKYWRQNILRGVTRQLLPKRLQRQMFSAQQLIPCKQNLHIYRSRCFDINPGLFAKYSTYSRSILHVLYYRLMDSSVDTCTFNVNYLQNIQTIHALFCIFYSLLEVDG